MFCCSVSVGKSVWAVLALIFTLVMTASCEKHDGQSYFKSKCEVDFGARTYIDQCPLSYIFSPIAIVTPYLCPCQQTDKGQRVEFMSYLREQRGKMPVFSVCFNLLMDADDVLGKTFVVKYDKTSGTQDAVRYTDYCLENGISYGTIAGEPVLEGAFTVTGRDSDNYLSGTFVATTVNGTYTGRFCLVNNLLPQSDGCTEASHARIAALRSGPQR